MRDYTNIAKGGVYELLDKYGNSDSKLYLVVSDNTYQTLTSNVMVCMIGEPEISERAQKYHVPFIMKQVKNDIELDIMPEILFNVKQNRLTKYKFTLNDSIMNKVSERIMRIMCGCELYTLDEAIVKLHDIELNRRLEYEFGMERKEIKEVVEVPENIDYEDLSCEDAQTMFAKSMKSDESFVTYDEPDLHERERDVTPPKKKSPKKKVTNTKAKTKKKPKKETKVVDRSNIINFSNNDTPYKYIYDHYEDYLMDYYSLSKEEIATKYNIPVKSIANRAYACRQISKKNGDDQTIWDEFQKDIIEKGKNGQRGITKAKEM